MNATAAKRARSRTSAATDDSFAAEVKLPLWSRPGFLIRRLNQIHYALFFEPRPGTPDDALVRLRDAVDDALAKNAAEYSRLRRNGLLAPLEVRRLAYGSYDRFRQEKVAAGSAEAQLKIPHLVSDPAAVPARA